MNIETIYESFFDTYRNMGQIILEQSQRRYRRASAVARGAAEGPQVGMPSSIDNLARDLNIAKLKAQAGRFADAAAKKAASSEQAATKKDGYSGGPRRKRAEIVNQNLKKTDGFETAKERETAIKRAGATARQSERLRKRFKGELDG